MKNHELLDMIGDVNEDYVQAANDNMARPRFRWKTFAAAAACAALVLGAYPIYRAVNPPLHGYVVMEAGRTLATYEDQAATIKAPAGGAASDAAPEASMIGGAYINCDPTYNEQSEEDLGSNLDGAICDDPWGDIPAQRAAEWYDALLRTYRLEENPEWYGGAWLAGDELLAVAIVDGFRTPELEAELKEAAGTGAVLRFSTVKYSMEFLYGLMEPATRALNGSDLFAGVGVDVMANCLGVDIYSDGQDVSNDVLAALAHLDPDGDAIRVRVYPGLISTYDDAAAKGPAPAAVASPFPRGAREEPSVEEQIPAEISAAPGMVESSMPACTESGQPARYGAQPRQVEELPQAKYDVTYGAEE